MGQSSPSKKYYNEHDKIKMFDDLTKTDGVTSWCITFRKANLTMSLP